VQVASASNQISELSEKSPIDLIILDLNLPGIPGLEFLHTIHRRWPEAPVILVPRLLRWKSAFRGLNAGADDFLVKPFAVAELVARVHAVLRRRNRPLRTLSASRISR